MRSQSLLTLVGLLSGASLSTPAQTLFTIPDTTPNYAEYRYADECISAVNRLTNEVVSKDSIWWDTASFQRTILPRMRPAVAVSVAKICFGQVDPDTIAVANAYDWAEYLLAVQRDTDAESLLVRALDSTPYGELGIRLAQVAKIYQRAWPARPQTTEKLYHHLRERIPDDSIVMTMYFRQVMMQVARVNGHFAMARTLEKEFKDLLDRIPPKETWSKESFTSVKKQFGRQSLREMFSEEGEDSLAVSTTAYRNHLMHIWKKYVDDDAKDTDVIEGLKAPSIKGNWYYTNNFTHVGGRLQMVGTYTKGAQVHRPVPGKINAIAFLNGDCHPEAWTFKYGRNGDMNLNCWPVISALKRLKEKYPAIEITVVSKTFGNYANGAPLTAEAEADTLASYLLGFHQIPGVHIVVEGEFIRIDGLDQRRVDIDAEYEYNYDFDGNRIAQAGTVLLIDDAGYIFFQDGITSFNELVAQRKVDIVRQRMETSSPSTSSH